MALDYLSSPGPGRTVKRVAVLASGGLDSAVLIADLAGEATVFPVYVEAGLAWEEEEKYALRAFLDALNDANVQPLTALELPLGRLYGEHWSTTGEGVPAYGAPDSAVYLPGRNVLLIGVTAVWSALHGIGTIAIGSLDANPFPDATASFFEGYGRLLSEALAHEIEVVAPYRGLHKSDLIARFGALPLHLTLTCMGPREGKHCGACNKCRERQEAFRHAGMSDRTRYAS